MEQAKTQRVSDFCRQARRYLLGVAIVAFAFSGRATMAQNWELGVNAGTGFLNNIPVTGALGSGSLTFSSGYSAGAFLSQHLYPFVSGEVRYSYRSSDLELRSGTTGLVFNTVSHLIHYDVLIHVRERGTSVRPFFAVGAGARVYEGKGQEQAFQPLSHLALLTRTRDIKPLISLGAGTSVRLSEHVYLRLEFRDLVTPFPKRIATPAPGSAIGGYVHDVVPMVAISFAP